MIGGDPSGTLRDLRTLFSDGMLGTLTDAQLLERFVDRDELSAQAAFTILVERHGPMVWGVCRRSLPDRSAAADAFQATFLVLLRRASAVRVGDSLGPWLYGVSRRVAARARAASLRHDARATGRVEAVAVPASDPGHAERLAILDEEIGRLSERHRAAVVLCDLEGLPHEEAARRLGCPVGTVESRLSRGRQRLRDRLVRRGVTPVAAALWAEMAREASAAMPATIIERTARSMTSSPAAGALPAAVTSLAEGVIRMIWLSRLKPLVVLAAAVTLATVGVAVQGRQQPEPGGDKGQSKAAPPAIPASSPKVADEAAANPVVAANQALAREQLARIDEAWSFLLALAPNARIEIGTGPFGQWGRRRLEALQKAGAGKAEVIAALEKYIKDLKELEAIAKAQKEAARATQLGVNEIQFLLLEAEIWLNEEKAR